MGWCAVHEEGETRAKEGPLKHSGLGPGSHLVEGRMSGLMRSVKGLVRATLKTQFSSLEKNQLDAVPKRGKALRMYLCPLQLLYPRFILKRVDTEIFPFDFLFSSQVSYTFLMGRA